MEGLLFIASVAVSGLIAALSAYVAQARWWLGVPGLVLLAALSAWGIVLVRGDSGFLWGAIPCWLSGAALAIYVLASRRDQRIAFRRAQGACERCGYPERAGSPRCPECGR